MRSPSTTKTAWSACVWLCAGIELPASIRIIPHIPPLDSTCWSIFIDTPGHPVGDQARADVSSVVWYMWSSPAAKLFIMRRATRPWCPSHDVARREPLLNPSEQLRRGLQHRHARVPRPDSLCLLGGDRCVHRGIT